MTGEDLATVPEYLRVELEAHVEEPASYAGFEWLCRRINVPTFAPIASQIDETVVRELGLGFCEKMGILPICRVGMYLTVAVARPWSAVDIDSLRNITYASIRLLATDSHIMASLFDILRHRVAVNEAPPKEVFTKKELLPWDTGYDVDNIDILINNAYVMGASDIHIEPHNNCVAVKYRVFGELRVQEPISKRYYNSVVRAIKRRAGIPESDKSSAKDGAFNAKLSAKKAIDIRVAVVPLDQEMENIVLRLLDQDFIKEKVGKLPFRRKREMQIFCDAINANSGLIVITGPTGSGKSTLVYTALMSLDGAKYCIRTIENPIEYRIPGLNQSQISDRFSWIPALKIFMRADPDVMLVGETRDTETAELTVQAANTGHIVLTTLHTNSAPGAVSRLRDLKLSNQEIAQALSVVVAQQLLPVMCPHCKYECEPTEGMKRHYRHYDLTPPTRTWKATGCERCKESRVVGRTPIFEFFYVTPKIRDMIANGAPMMELERENAIEFKPMLIDAMGLVAEGIVEYENIRAYECAWSDFNG